MKGNPGVTTFRHAGRDQIYAFLRSDNDRLVCCYLNMDPMDRGWRWSDLGQPQGVGLDGSPTAVTSIQTLNATENFLHAFVRGDDDHLYERFWDGGQWVDWVNHDRPVWNVGVVMSPGAATFQSPGSNVDELYVFVWGDDERLYRRQIVLGNSTWHNQGNLPNGARVLTEPAVIMIPFAGLFLYAYVVGSDGHLYVNYTSDRRRWDWRDLGQPDSNTTVVWGLIERPGVLLFGNRALSFVRGSDDQLWVSSWLVPQAQGGWTPLGIPAVGNPMASEVSVVLHDHEGVIYTYAFVRSNNDHLFVCRWDGQNDLHWVDLGRPSTGGHDVIALPEAGDTRVSSAPGAVTFRYVEQNQATERIFAFVLGDDGHLHQCYWNGVDLWLWNDLLTPP